ncbi:protein kintoun-like [Mya arenaria]|uniref:protein kintoun-like n=1 Tax=Mya arenaria TaxID=6604 RepID=UPI0022E1B7EC|nr:protein kintoun-like [Mya arenaria]
MASNKTFEDLDLSREEIKRIEEALKDEKFRKMFVEYAEEISNPENRKRYEEEIAMMEQEKGMDVQFVNPEPGHTIKTTIDGKKSFINICKNDKMGKPSSHRRTNNTGVSGLQWQIPHSFSPPREEFDKAKKTCMVYDVVFHPDTYTMSRNQQFRKMVEDTAMEGIERQFGVKIDKNNIRHPKLNYKGAPVATVIRSRKGDKKLADNSGPLANMPYPYGDKTSAELAEEKKKEIAKRYKDKANQESKTKFNKNTKKEDDGYTTPKYTIIHRTNMDLQEYRNAPDSRPSTRPKEIVVSIELPLCKSATGVDLDIFEDKLFLQCQEPAYKLDLKLPYFVDDEEGSARFDKSKKSLVVILPVVAVEVPSIPTFIEEDGTNSGENDALPSLIEELPPLEEVADGVITNDEFLPLEDIKDLDKDTQPELFSKSLKAELSYIMPQYDFNQDIETVTFIFHVRNIKEDSVTRSFKNPSSLEVKFISVGSGGFPMHYSFFADFDPANKLVAEHTSVDVGDKNTTVTLLKHKSCRSLWNKFLAGPSITSTVEKLFLTTDNLQEDLDQLQAEGKAMGQADTHKDSYHDKVKVTEMNEKKLSLKIMKSGSSFSEDNEAGMSDDEAPLSASIEVVHSKEVPNLHGILKQRSISESSEDPTSSSGDSPTSTSPRDNDGGRHSVTFNSHIDRASFKTNASVSSMTQALKSKRRNRRKREERKERGPRRRHNSASSEGSSCDEGDLRLGAKAHEGGNAEEETTDKLVKKSDNCEVIEEDRENEEKEAEEEDNSENKLPRYQMHSKNCASGKSEKCESGNIGSKIASQVINKLATSKEDADDEDSDDDVEDGERTVKSSEIDTVINTDENQKKFVDKISDVAEVAKKVEGIDLNSGTNGSSEDSGGSNADCDTAGAMNDTNQGKGSKKTTGVRLKGANGGNGYNGKSESKGSKEENGSGKKEESGKGDNAADGKGKNEVETEMSWRDSDRNNPYNAHRTQCAFNFSNDVLFDLDID